MPSFLPCRIARRMILRSTYPRHSFDGTTPSAIRNVIARRWSAITRMDTSDGRSSVAPYRYAGPRANRVENRHEQVGVVVRQLSLDDRGDAFEAHPRVDRWRRQRVQRPVRLPVEFHEDVVPDFDVPVAAAIDAPAWTAGAFLVARNVVAAEVVNLRTASARARVAHLPEILGQSQLGDRGSAGTNRCQIVKASSSRGIPDSPLKIVGKRRSGGRCHTVVNSSQAKGIASALK